MDPITPSTPAFHLPQVKSDTPSRITLNRSSVATLEDRGPTFTNGILAKRMQKRILKNCIECIVHIGVVFLSRLVIYNASDVLNLICVASLDIQVCVIFCIIFLIQTIFSDYINASHVLFFTCQNKVAAMILLFVTFQNKVAAIIMLRVRQRMTNVFCLLQ